MRGESTPPSKSDRIRHARVDLWIGLAIFVVLLVVQQFIKRLPLTQNLTWAGHQFLSSYLRSPKPGVAIVDINDINIDLRIAPERSLTNRQQLIDVIQAIDQVHPACIVIYIDLSSTWIPTSSDGSAGYYKQRVPMDKQLYAACENASVPVILAMDSGVGRNIKSYFIKPSRDDWGGNGAIYGSKAASFNQWIYDTKYDQYFPSLAERVVEKCDYRSSHPWLPNWMLSQFQYEELENGLWGQMYVADYTLIDAIPVVPTHKKPLAQGQKMVQGPSFRLDLDEGATSSLKNRVVLVGFARTGHPGAFAKAVPGRFASQRQEYPSIFLTACAINTLAFAPVYHLNAAGEWILDIVFGLTLAMLLFFARVWCISREWGSWRDMLSSHGLEKAMSLLFYGATVVFVFQLVSIFRVIWDGLLPFLLFAPLESAVALLFERRPVESWVKQFDENPRATLTSVWKRVSDPLILAQSNFRIVCGKLCRKYFGIVAQFFGDKWSQCHTRIDSWKRRRQRPTQKNTAIQDITTRDITETPAAPQTSVLKKSRNHTSQRRKKNAGKRKQGRGKVKK